MAVGADIVGVVLNRFEVHNGSYYTYYAPSDEDRQSKASRWFGFLRPHHLHHQVTRMRHKATGTLHKGELTTISTDEVGTSHPGVG
jgi:hypothetical protein